MTEFDYLTSFCGVQGIADSRLCHYFRFGHVNSATFESCRNRGSRRDVVRHLYHPYRTVLELDRDLFSRGNVSFAVKVRALIALGQPDVNFDFLSICRANEADKTIRGDVLDRVRRKFHPALDRKST